MHLLIEIAAALLFVLSVGLLFNEGVRASRVLFVAIGIVALASSYVITKSVLDSTHDRRFHIHAAHTATAPIPAAPSTAIADTVLQTVYSLTQDTLNRFVRSGTGQSAASVSSDTVVDVIVGISLAVLGLLSQVVSAMVRRITGSA